MMIKFIRLLAYMNAIAVLATSMLLDRADRPALIVLMVFAVVFIIISEINHGQK